MPSRAPLRPRAATLSALVALYLAGCSAPPAPTAPDQPPVASAGTDISVLVGETVVLDGSASSDADGDPLAYEWTAGEENPASAVLTPTSRVSFVPAAVGTYYFLLTVSARGVDSQPDSIRVTVAAQDAHPPVADAGIDQRPASPQSRIVLDGSASSDSDGDSLTFRWQLVVGPAPVILADSSAAQTRVTVSQGGDYTFRLTVSDGAFTSSDEVLVAVAPAGNTPPQAEAGPNQTVAVGTLVTLDGSGSADPDGSGTLTYQWQVGRNPGESVVLSDAAAVRPSFTPSLVGDYVFGLVVSDGASSSLQDTVVIAVTEQTYSRRSGMIEIPGGPFTMGTAQTGFTDDKPEHEVDLSTFWMDSVEVSVAQYQICVNEGACAPAGQAPGCNAAQAASRGSHPINCVTWAQAGAFCGWASKRLPTEAEWEKAARGVNDHRRFPWGDGDPTLLVLADPTLRLVNYNNLYGDTQPVGAFPDGASPYGVQDLAGNVMEWTSDYYDALYYAASPRRDPQGPASGEQRVGRGGHYLAPADASTTTVRNRVQPGSREPALGFRCARTTSPP
ncbi:MAG: SUMF1/EgtB/PvdO family nonheme iron enzyme [Gemmatimonadota bacterium]